MKSILVVICSLIGHKVNLLDECRLFNRDSQSLETKCSRCNFDMVLIKDPLHGSVNL
jgi:hypothetical protein